MPLAHITLAVRDVAGTSEFFQTVFAWRPLDRPGNIDRAAAWLAIADAQEIHLLQVDDFEPSRFEAEFGRHIALFHPGDDMAALRERLANAGAEIIEEIRATPFERFFFREPNGYVFEVIDQDGYRPE
jgi:catechol 2,3-dioxygenase-like lactoylglutathione lyase family enzyme